jgi:hypothetical protein
MKLIIFNDGTSEIEVGLSFSGAFVTISDDDGETYVGVECIDKLIEALQNIKGELS